jgi:murein DD-endopeptidase MepM/ murein hydrolase activator NlpD
MTDHESLNRTGLVLAVVFFVMAFFILSPVLSSVLALSSIGGTDVIAMDALPVIEEEAYPEDGMGGMAYTEDIVSDVNGTLVSFIPEAVPLPAGVPEIDEYSKPQMLFYTPYKIKSGDTIGGIAIKYGLNQSTLLSINAVKNARNLKVDSVLRIPNQDGILHTVQLNETVTKIAQKYEIDGATIKMVNELFSDYLVAQTFLFIPGAKLDFSDLQEINGELFLRPISGRLTSRYGYRSDPFGGNRTTFHTGIDIAAPSGTAIKPAMSGQIVTASYNSVYGNYVIIRHHSGYRTLYGHMSVIKVKTGDQVEAGKTTIGLVGSTGQSTGPHLHFTVYKDNVTMDPLTLIKY